MPWRLTENDRRLVDRIMREEGFREKPYNDHLGNPTIGYGTLLAMVTPGELEKVWKLPGNPRGGLTENQAQLLLKMRLRTAIEDCQRFAYWDSLTPERKRALVDMRYQLGSAGIRKFRKMHNALKAGKWEKAHTEALNSLWAQQTPNRAKRVAEDLRDG